MPTSRLSWLHPLMHWFPFFKESIVFTVEGKYVFPCVFSGKCLLSIWKQVLSLVLISLYLVSYIWYMYVHMHMQIYMYCLVMHACTCGIHVHVVAAYSHQPVIVQYSMVWYSTSYSTCTYILWHILVLCFSCVSLALYMHPYILCMCRFPEVELNVLQWTWWRGCFPSAGDC